MGDLSVKEFLAKMPQAFLPEKAAGVDAVIQFKFTGAQAADVNVTIRDQTCTVAEGPAPGAKLTVTADSDDFVQIFTGKMDGMQAFMSGKLRLAGDMNLAMKLMSMFAMK
ncbi:MAG: SCP2 sterol-binding domain-containing protein [Anaerolineales bacterium]|nr:SCP2 sterol-binding domain-containing protein [Anaerolineales bacterium]